MKIRVIGVPSAWGTKELGAARTPDALRDAGLLQWLGASGHEVEDAGDVGILPQPSTPGANAEGSDTDQELQHLNGVAHMAAGVRSAVGVALQDGFLPLIVGGECSICVGAVPALAASHGAPTVAWIDAHGDMNTPDTSQSGLLTGMPFAVMLGHGPSALVAIGDDHARPTGDTTFLIGGRDLDDGEITNLSAFGVQHLDTETTRAIGPEAVAMRILSLPEIAVMPPEARAELAAMSARSANNPGGPGARDMNTPVSAGAPVYLHIDVDSIDPELAPGVHYRVAGGFDPDEVAAIAGYLCASDRVAVLTIASANLDHDIDGRTVASIRDVIVSIADALALRSA